MEDNESKMIIFAYCAFLIAILVIIGMTLGTKTNELNKICWNETEKRTVTVPGVNVYGGWYSHSAELAGVWVGECASRLKYDYTGTHTYFYNPKNYTDYCLMKRTELKCKIEGINTLDGVN